MPCTIALKAALDAAKAALSFAPMPNCPILTTQDGGRMTCRCIAEIMLKGHQRLGLEAHDLHAMRHRGIMELAWAGCDDDEIMSYSGHATKRWSSSMPGKRARSCALVRRGRNTNDC
ncbi:hypothetical protein CG51_03075 [Haematobacter missouriensis]|nr:hypothetical protein CG51_03075 [Haematobacter missouriensis]